MKSARLFFAGLVVISLAFIAITLVPKTVKAIPKAYSTGEYPEAVGARCMDVDYGKPASLNETLDLATTSAISVTSPNPKGPVNVSIGLYVDEITEVDEGANSFKMDGYLDTIWCNPKLAFDAAQQGAPVKIFLNENALLALDQMWRPALEFVNAEEPVNWDNIALLVHPDGTIEYRSKFDTRLASNFNLHSFPFDNQDLMVEIESFEWASDTMVFLAQDGIVGFSEEFHIPEWYVTDISERIESKKEIRDHNNFSEFIATIHVNRDPGVYITKVMIPLGVIILISMVIFWVDPSSFESRLSTSMTGLLTAVAYQFIASDNLPKHVYNTYLDAFIFLSFLVILFGIGESGYVNWLIGKNKEEQATQIDRTSRWFMPLLYIVMIVALYFVYTVSGN